MRRPLTLILALCAITAMVAASIATAAKPTVVRAGNVVIKFNGGVTPKKLPRRKMAPITLNASGKISTVDGKHPPAAQQIRIDFDKNGSTNAKGLPVCKPGKLEARTTAAAKKACPKAIVGSGSTAVEVEFAESAPFTAKGPLVLFNGGVKGGKTMMFIHAYVSVPAPTAIVTPVKITKIRKGRYGTRADARIPVIAGGSGSVTSFNLKVRRNFRRGGKKQSYLTARCANGRFFADATAVFKGGPRLRGTVVRPCTPRG
jgi:hypothetical protein